MSQYEVDHGTCPAGSHDREVTGLGSEQARAADGLMGCNDCGLPLFYCEVAGWYFHCDREAECFLSPGWGAEPYDVPACTSESPDYPGLTCNLVAGHDGGHYALGNRWIAAGSVPGCCELGVESCGQHGES